MHLSICCILQCICHTGLCPIDGHGHTHTLALYVKMTLIIYTDGQAIQTVTGVLFTMLISWKYTPQKEFVVKIKTLGIPCEWVLLCRWWYSICWVEVFRVLDEALNQRQLFLGSWAASTGRWRNDNWELTIVSKSRKWCHWYNRKCWASCAYYTHIIDHGILLRDFLGVLDNSFQMRQPVSNLHVFDRTGIDNYTLVLCTNISIPNSWHKQYTSSHAQKHNTSFPVHPPYFTTHTHICCSDTGGDHVFMRKVKGKRSCVLDSTAHRKSSGRKWCKWTRST